MEMFTEIITGATVAVGLIVAFIIKILKGKKEIEDNIPKKIKKQSGINIEITEQLEYLKEFLNADRVQVYDFHNGGHYANGRSALKTDCTYEVVRSGIKPVQMHLQDIPLSCIPRFTNRMLEEGYMEIKNLEEIKDSMPSTYQLKTEMGICAFYDIILNNKFGEPIGFLAIQYVKNQYCLSSECDKQEVLKVKHFIEDRLNQMLFKK